jgi:signal transduction histidine kinase
MAREWRNLNILHVDDSESDCRHLQQILRERKALAKDAKWLSEQRTGEWRLFQYSGIETADAFASGPPPGDAPNVAIIDVAIGESYDGLNLIESLRSIDPYLAIVVLTQSLDLSVWHKALDAGADHVLFKWPKVDQPRLELAMATALLARKTIESRKAEDTIADLTVGFAHDLAGDLKLATETIESVSSGLGVGADFSGHRQRLEDLVTTLNCVHDRLKGYAEAARCTRGAIPVRSAEFKLGPELNRICEQRVRICQARFSDQEIECTLDISNDNDVIRTDLLRVELIVSVLVNNAIEHHRPWGTPIRVHIFAKKIYIYDLPWVEIHVCDNGEGIPADIKETLGRIAGVVSQKIDSGLSGRKQGLGQGNYSARQMASQLKRGSEVGQIKFENNGLLGGAEFTVLVPESPSGGD